MIVRKLISIIVLTVWVLTQTSMLFAHAGSGDHDSHAKPASAGHHDHQHQMTEPDSITGLAGNISNDQGPAEPDMAGMECCGNTCTVDAQLLPCQLGSQIIRAFNSTKVVTLSATELASPKRPPNTTI